MAFSEIIALVSVLIAFVSVLFTVRNSKRNDVQDIERRASENATINTKLDNIQANVIDMKVEISSTNNDVSKLTERVVAVEESAKSAHKRIDSVEERIKE